MMYQIFWSSLPGNETLDEIGPHMAPYGPGVCDCREVALLQSLAGVVGSAVHTAHCVKHGKPRNHGASHMTSRASKTTEGIRVTLEY